MNADDLVSVAYAAMDAGRYEEALRTLTTAREQGDLRSCFYLGWLHEEGLGTTLDLAKARNYYEQALNSGEYEVCSRLAKLIEEEDRALAISILRKGVAAGDRQSVLSLGYLLSEKEHATFSPVEASALLRDSADQGNVLAYRRLASLHFSGALPNASFWRGAVFFFRGLFTVGGANQSGWRPPKG
ncbi:MAG: tetratricopeptide repeat protein [Casimicrobium sp.]